MMDIKQTLLGMLGNGYRSVMVIEKIVFVMMKQYLKAQDKRCNLGNIINTDNRVFRFDMIFPDGIDDITEPIAVEVKATKSIHIVRNAIRRIGTYIDNKDVKIKKILVISFADLSDTHKREILEESQKYSDGDFILWDINDLCECFKKNEDSFYEICDNINALLLQETVRRGIEHQKTDRENKQRKYIEHLKNAYENNDVVLFLGAGVSKDAKIATWDELVSKLFITLLNKEIAKHNHQLTSKQQEQIEKKIVEQYGGSPLILTRFLKQGLKESFEDTVREVLYQNTTGTSELLTEIAQLCVPGRKKFGIEAIVNYNFDDLIEKQLKILQIQYQSIYAEGMNSDRDELGIYHVHGFLPQNGEEYENLSDSLLVFSEEGYHQLMIEPYHWANMRQLNYMINNTCVFVGLSMTDPNMRRLLDIAAQQKSNRDDACQHYAFMRKLALSDTGNNRAMREFEGVNEALQEDVFKGLGVNVIWFNEYSDLPKLIKKIKGNT